MHQSRASDPQKRKRNTLSDCGTPGPQQSAGPEVTAVGWLGVSRAAGGGECGTGPCTGHGDCGRRGGSSRTDGRSAPRGPTAVGSGLRGGGGMRRPVQFPQQPDPDDQQLQHQPVEEEGPSGAEHPGVPGGLQRLVGAQQEVDGGSRNPEEVQKEA